MRVLFVTPTLGPGGAERLVISYLKGLTRRGVAVTVCFGFGQALRPLVEEAGIEAHRISDVELGLRTLPEWRRELSRVVREFRPDVLYAHSVTAALLCRIVAPRTPLLVTVHGIQETDERQAAAILRSVGARVTAVSAASAQGIGRHLGAPPVELIAPGVDVAALEAAASRPPSVRPWGTPALLCVARQHPAKGVDVLLRAFPRVLDRLPEARLLIVGGGYDLDVHRALATSLGIAEQVRFTGLLTNAAPYIHASDLVVMPSRREGLPVLILETFALRRTVVASAVGGVPTVVREGETGWLVPPEDEAALADAIVDAAGRPEDRRRFGDAGRQIVLERFSAERSLDRVDSMLHELARGQDSRLLLRPTSYYRAVRAVKRAEVARGRRRRSDWRGVRIFAYHRVVDEPDDVLAVTPAAFAEHMEALRRSGVVPVPLDEALDLLQAPVEGRFACVTFDDAYRDNLDHAAPVLERLEIPATIFVPTWIVGGQASYYWYREAPPALDWEQLRDLVAGGLFEVGAHSRTHPRLPALTAERLYDEVVGSGADIEDRLGRTAHAFAYPAGLFGPREASSVRAAGYRAGLSTADGVNSHETPAEALRRTMIFWGDRREEFTAKLDGATDRPLGLRSLVHARRSRA